MLDIDHDALLGEDSSTDEEAIQEFLATASQTQIQNWINLNTKTIKLSVVEAREKSIQQVMRLTRYFGRAVGQPLATRVRHRRQRLKKPPDIGRPVLHQRSIRHFCSDRGNIINNNNNNNN